MNPNMFYTSCKSCRYRGQLRSTSLYSGSSCCYPLLKVLRRLTSSPDVLFLRCYVGQVEGRGRWCQ
ncbi:hypothetical protein HanIR_Chr15g0775551 [Helianthus annuus]|nr:hypothetical protein HanIR_Chr15g0775551 [Helianthus annuus]